jgi:hypothetical protein
MIRKSKGDGSLVTSVTRRRSWECNVTMDIREMRCDWLRLGSRMEFRDL